MATPDNMQSLKDSFTDKEMDLRLPRVAQPDFYKAAAENTKDYAGLLAGQFALPVRALAKAANRLLAKKETF